MMLPGSDRNLMAYWSTKPNALQVVDHGACTTNTLENAKPTAVTPVAVYAHLHDSDLKLICRTS